MPNSIAVAVRDRRGIWSRRATVTLEPDDTLEILVEKSRLSEMVPPLPGTPLVDILSDNRGYYSPGAYLRDPQSMESAFAGERLLRPPWWRVWMRRVFWWLCVTCALTWAWYLIRLWVWR